MTNRNGILNNLGLVREKLTDTSELYARHKELKNEKTVVAEMIQKCLNENAHIAQNQEKYREEYKWLAERFREVKAEFYDVTNQREEKKQTIYVGIFH